ncbi:MAG: hypothetical protein A2176_08320 [Spirochaetes bacterium RBG_13_51_14]|nr:MAG: hypothetical protein A2176_08320 [Spirochaetes bacterium RBG_13_51_14]
MVAQKGVKGSSHKKKRSPAKVVQKTAKQSGGAPRGSGRGRNPAYILIILGLVTAIALLVNRFGEHREPPGEKPRRESARIDGDTKEREELREKKSEQKNSVESDEKSRNEKGQKKAEEKPAVQDVKVYFVKLNEKTEKIYLTTVSRKVGKGSVLENAMKELIKGPTPVEKKKGLLSAVPARLRINGIRIKNGSAEIDFNGAIEQGAAGSVLINRIDQIVYTATQFNNVKSVIIKINGRTRQTLGTDGLSIGGPLHRGE